MSWNDKVVPFSTLVGKTLTKVENVGPGDALVFVTSEGETYKMYHRQDCCEGVSIDDICGDLNDLVGSPIVMADERSDTQEPPAKEKYDEAYEWTFYRIATNKGTVVVRWYGSSNGYYSTSVDFVEVGE